MLVYFYHGQLFLFLNFSMESLFWLFNFGVFLAWTAFFIL